LSIAQLRPEGRRRIGSVTSAWPDPDGFDWPDRFAPWQLRYVVGHRLDSAVARRKGTGTGAAKHQLAMGDKRSARRGGIRQKSAARQRAQQFHEQRRLSVG